MIRPASKRLLSAGFIAIVLQLAWLESAVAMPAFAANWEDKTANLGDERLRLPAELPLGIRAQAEVFDSATVTAGYPFKAGRSVSGTAGGASSPGFASAALA